MSAGLCDVRLKLSVTYDSPAGWHMSAIKFTGQMTYDTNLIRIGRSFVATRAQFTVGE